MHPRSRFFWRGTSLLGLLLCFLCNGARSQTYSILHHFDSLGGAAPSGPLALYGSSLYGTTAAGGSSGTACYGTAFRVDTDGANFMVLRCWYWSADAGATPSSGLVFSGTCFYGATERSYQSYGDGTLFRMDSLGNFALLKKFEGTNGSRPQTVLLAGQSLYGTTRGGGSLNHGTVFSLNTNGTSFAILKSFSGDDGSLPNGSLVLSGDQLFGTTAGGLGESVKGVVFTVRTNGAGFAVLKVFGGADGAYPAAGLVLVDGTLYGTTQNGGAWDKGTIFKLNLDGTGFRVLKEFSGPDGAQPMASLQVAGSRLYGTTAYGGASAFGGLNGDGTVFKVNLDGSGFLVLKHFAGTDGARPSCPLLLSANSLFGHTSGGGTSSCGVVFRFTLPSAPFIIIPPSERVVAVDGQVAFSVEALGEEPLSYRWFFNETNLVDSGQAPVLALSQAQFSDSGLYSVVVSNRFGLATSPPALLRVIPQGLVTNCSEADLRASLRAGGRIKLDCDGILKVDHTIHIEKDTSLDASGRDLTLCGSHSVRLFHVHSNVSFTASNLTLARGASTEGAGLYNDGGRLTLLSVSFLDNLCTNWPVNYYETGPLRGAAVFNRAGAVAATNCLFAGNTLCSGGQWSALGAAIFNDAGTLCLEHCVFSNNIAIAGSWIREVAETNGLSALGGAICSQGSLRANACTFVGNSALAGAGAPGQSYPHWGDPGGVAQGGALANLGSAELAGCLLASNTVVGGAGGKGGSGGWGPFNGSPGGPGGFGQGAALFSTGPCVLQNCTLAWNQARGGPGGQGGDGGWYIDMGTGQMLFMPGGFGGEGGSGMGTVFSPSGLLELLNCTVAYNRAFPGEGGTGGPGNPRGPIGVAGTVAGALVTTNSMLLNTILAVNSPANSSGIVTDGGHNLSSDGSCHFAAVSSKNDTDPRIGPLMYDGGPTLTIPLLPGSPALDAADTVSFPPLDQRAYVRPLGFAPDIGAYEYGLPVRLQASLNADGLVTVSVCAAPGQICSLLSSADLSAWIPLATSQVARDGIALFEVDVTWRPQQFYRAVLP